MQKIGQYVSVEDSKAVVAVRGDFKLEVTDRVRDELEEAYRMGCTAVRFDMNNTDYIDSTVNKIIIRTLRHVGERMLEISNPKRSVFAALEARDLAKFIVNGGKRA